jgi:hypothetical protein
MVNGKWPEDMRYPPSRRQAKKVKMANGSGALSEPFTIYHLLLTDPPQQKSLQAA